MPLSTGLRRAIAVSLFSALVAACVPAAASGPPGPIVPGTASKPREVVVIAHDYVFDPTTIDLVPGEIVLIHFFDAGLLPHELVIGDAALQDAWEKAEADAPPAAPGQTPAIRAPQPGGGLRVVAASGQRIDVTWTVPSGLAGLVAGCHIPGHWAKGMQAAVRLVEAPAASR